MGEVNGEGYVNTGCIYVRDKGMQYSGLKSFSFENDLLPELIAKNMVDFYFVDGVDQFYDIGTLDRFHKFSDYFREI